MASFRSPGPTCVTTEPVSDSGTLPRGRAAVSCPIGWGANGHELHKRSDRHRQLRVPGMSATDGDRALRKAIDDALKLFEQRQQDMERWNAETEENFLAWFGSTDKKARDIISGRIGKAIAKLKRMTIRDFTL